MKTNTVLTSLTAYRIKTILLVTMLAVMYFADPSVTFTASQNDEHLVFVSLIL